MPLICVVLRFSASELWCFSFVVQVSCGVPELLIKKLRAWRSQLHEVNADLSLTRRVGSHRAWSEAMWAVQPGEELLPLPQLVMAGVGWVWLVQPYLAGQLSSLVAAHRCPGVPSRPYGRFTQLWGHGPASRSGKECQQPQAGRTVTSCFYLRAQCMWHGTYLMQHCCGGVLVDYDIGWPMPLHMDVCSCTQ